jgi:Putative Ig domain
MKNAAKAILMAVLLILIGCPSTNVPVLLAATPSTIPTGSPATQLTLVGQNFAAPVSVTWTENSQSVSLPTTLVSSSELLATVPASELTEAGSAQVKATSGTNQTATASLSITISNIAPTLTNMSPAHVIVGAASPTITLTGTNFNSTSTVDWNTTGLPTTFVNSTTLTAIVPTALYTSPGTSSITVVNSGTGGGTTAALTFNIIGVLSITTASLPGGSIGSAYSATLAATGGVTPYNWTITTGSLPTGLTLNSSTGVVSGTPTAAGSASFTVTCTDSTGTMALKKLR